MESKWYIIKDILNFIFNPLVLTNLTYNFDFKYYTLIRANIKSPYFVT